MDLLLCTRHSWTWGGTFSVNRSCFDQPIQTFLYIRRCLPSVCCCWNKLQKVICRQFHLPKVEDKSIWCIILCRTITIFSTFWGNRGALLHSIFLVSTLLPLPSFLLLLLLLLFLLHVWLELPRQANAQQWQATNLWYLKQGVSCQIGKSINPREEHRPESNIMNK